MTDSENSIVTSTDSLRALYAQPIERIAKKQLDHASDEASADRIGNLIKYDWHHSVGHLLQGGYSRGGASKDDVWGECHQFRCSFAKIAVFPSVLNL